MAEKSALRVKKPALGTISNEIIEAKKDLRDRLLPAAQEALPQALSFRKSKRFQPAPGINLVGVGIGEKITSDKRTGEMCVKVHVAKKFPMSKISSTERIPSTIGGVPT